MKIDKNPLTKDMNQNCMRHDNRQKFINKTHESKLYEALQQKKIHK